MSGRELRRRLVDAIGNVDLDAVRSIARSDPAIVESKTSHHNTPLGEAIATGSLDLVELLVDLGADPGYRNHGGHGALDAAAFSGHARIGGYLVSQGLEPSVHHVAAMGDVQALADMLGNAPQLLGLSRAGGRWRMTPLHAAARVACVEAVEFLLSIGVDVDQDDHNGHTALAGLVDSNLGGDRRVRVAAALIAHGADVDTGGGHHGGVVLHRAIIAGDQPMTHLLLDAGADPNLADASGKTALHHAVSKNRVLVELVLRRCPDPTLKTRARRTPKGDHTTPETALALARRLKKKAAAALIEAYS